MYSIKLRFFLNSHRFTTSLLVTRYPYYFITSRTNFYLKIDISTNIYCANLRIEKHLYLLSMTQKTLKQTKYKKH